MTGITITQAALHAILRSARYEVVSGSTPRGVGMIDTLLTLMDPAHAAPPKQGAVSAPAPATTPVAKQVAALKREEGPRFMLPTTG
jgi:hypothetical protein